MGIVGLPNIGKSTLFNALTNLSIEAKNFPFCTIDPNKGIVPIPDERLTVLSTMSNSATIVPATIEFIDIAGLVKGASKGDGLGNQFLANIRDTSAIVHVVRCFDDDDIIHVDGGVDPARDIDIINTELLLADIKQCETMLAGQKKRARSQKDADTVVSALTTCLTALQSGTPLRSLSWSESELAVVNGCQFLTSKPMMYVCNVSDQDMVTTHPHSMVVQSSAQEEGANVLALSAHFEYEVSQMDDTEKMAILEAYGLTQSGLERLAQESFCLLNLQTFLTTGEKETRAWTIPVGTCAPQAAGAIHTDFEKGFIRANVVDYNTFVACGGQKGARDKGNIRQEGKDYVVKDGDVIEFLFNV